MIGRRKTTTTFIARISLVLLLIGFVPVIANAQGGQGDPRDGNPGSSDLCMRHFYYRMKNAKEFATTEYGGCDVLRRIDASQGFDRVTNGLGGLVRSAGNLLSGNTGAAGQAARNAMQAFGGQDGRGPKESVGPGTVKTQSGPTFAWPVPVPMGIPSTVPTKRDEGINKNELKTFGYPVSDTQFQLIQRYNQNIMLEQLANPERFMWAATTLGGLQSTSAANSAGNMATNQAISAIDFSKKYLVNFTAEQGNVWHRLRDQLFIPMAILLLLPGAVLAQVKAIVAQGSPSWAQADSPIEGITRSIVAVFLIPATFLVINYGIDVSNSITFTIADEYKRIFGTDMYEDAICHEKRAFASNPANRQENAIHQEERPVNRGTSVWSSFEGLNSTVREYDPCLGVDNTRVPDENAVQAKNWGRLSKNMANTGITAAWNIMSAFQMAYLYYLWCMGPIAAALWVWPINPMRNALRSWIEGVITLCFWSLFWNTTILLLACFKGVGDDGSIIVTALNTLANLAVKKAFDFAGLVAEAGTAASGEMQKAMSGGGGGGGGGRGGGGGGAGGAGGQGGQGSAGRSIAGPGGGGSLTGPGGGADPSVVNPSGGALALSPSGGDLSNSAFTPRGGADIDPVTGLPRDASVAGVDPGLPPGERGTAMGMRGGADDATEAAALAALGAARGGLPPSDQAAFAQLKKMDDQGHPAATATMEALAKTQPGDLEKAMANDPNAAERVRQATGMSANTLNDALRGDSTAMMTAAAVVGAAGSAGAAGQLMARAEQGDPAARAQLEGRTGVSADTLIRAANGSEQDQIGVMARAGLDGSVRAAAMAGDPVCGDAVRAADLTYARNASTGDFTQISAYDGASGRYAATDSQGGIMRGTDGSPLITFDQASGTYRTADGAGVNYDSGTGQWMARDASGASGSGVVFDMNDQRFEVAGTGAPVNFENGTYVAAGTDGNVVWDAQASRFADRSTGGAVMSDPSGSGQWFRVSQDGQSIERLAGGAAGQANWERSANAPMEVRNGEVIAAGSNGNVIFDQAQGRFEARNVDVGVQYDQATNQWYAQGSSGQVAYSADAAQFRATGTNEGVTYSGGQWAVDNTGGRVVFDAAQGRYEVAGANAAVAYDRASSNWVAADTGGQIRFDRQDMRFETSNGAVAVVDPNGSGRWYAAAADGSVSMLSPASSGSASWSTAGADAPVSYNNGTFVAQGSGGAVFYDQTAGQWELRQQSAQGGGYVDTNIAMARDSASGNWVARDTGGQVVLDPASRQLEIYGTNTAVARDNTGTFVAANTSGSVFLDTQNQGGARWEVRGTDTPVMQSASGQWVAADSRGGVVWDAQQNRFEKSDGSAPVYRDPGGSGWYAVASSGMVSQLGSDAQWRSVDPQTSPIRVDQGGAVIAAASNGMIQYDQRDNRWEIAGTNQAVQYDSRSQQWVAPETGGRVAYDFNDRRLEVVGSTGATTNVPVVSDPGGRGYYAFAPSGEVRQLDSTAGSWRAVDASAGVAYSNGQLYSTASISPTDATRTPQVTFDTQQGYWKVDNNPNPSYNGIAVSQVGSGFYADGTGRQIEYDLNNRRFELAGSGRPVEYAQGGWTYAGTGEQVALRTPDGGWTAGTHASTDPTRVHQGYDPFANPSAGYRHDAAEVRHAEMPAIRDFPSHPGSGGHVEPHYVTDASYSSGVMDTSRRERMDQVVKTAGGIAGIGAIWANWSGRMNRAQQGGALPSLYDQLPKNSNNVRKKDKRKPIGIDENGNPIYEA